MTSRPSAAPDTLEPGSARAHRFGPRASRRRKVQLVGLALAAALLLGACTSGEEDHAVDLVNSARRANGKAALATNVSLIITAQAWSQHMASTQKLMHRTQLSDGAPAGWRKLGENIGYASSVDAIQTAFMGSAGHKANILDSAFNNVGIGITRDGNGRYWETQEFAAL
ncbi:MAG: CAP domain-containing protein [Acidimicrobiales bacterium]